VSILDSLDNDLKKVLYETGATLVGFANLNSVVQGDLMVGVSVAVAIPPVVIQSIENGPTMDYYDAYYRINRLLDQIVTAGAEYLTGKGHQAYAQTTDVVTESDDYRTALPHKTVATRAGIGWIGKCALLVTKEYGSAVRLSSLITNAPLECAAPILDSRCGNCMLCTDACPGKAVSGKLWSAGIDRDTFFNPIKCRKAARELAAEQIEKEITLCGKCIYVCPYTQRYLHKP
jgi:epoxyqueuosine reductase